MASKGQVEARFPAVQELRFLCRNGSGLPYLYGRAQPVHDPKPHPSGSAYPNHSVVNYEQPNCRHLSPHR